VKTHFILTTETAKIWKMNGQDRPNTKHSFSLAHRSTPKLHWPTLSSMTVLSETPILIGSHVDSQTPLVHVIIDDRALEQNTNPDIHGTHPYILRRKESACWQPNNFVLRNTNLNSETQRLKGFLRTLIKVGAPRDGRCVETMRAPDRSGHYCVR
jgi:hypothetical protein